jgi:hypothetical protein
MQESVHKLDLFRVIQSTNFTLVSSFLFHVSWSLARGNPTLARLVYAFEAAVSWRSAVYILWTTATYSYVCTARKSFSTLVLYAKSTFSPCAKFRNSGASIVSSVFISFYFFFSSLFSLPLFNNFVNSVAYVQSSNTMTLMKIRKDIEIITVGIRCCTNICLKEKWGTLRDFSS